MFANIRGRRLDGPLHFPSERSFNWHSHARSGEAVVLARVFEQRPIAAFANVFDDRRDDTLGLFESHRFTRDQPRSILVIENPNHHITILLSGYSTMPCAPASLRRGIIVRTVVSSRIVLTASHSSSLSVEMVGFLSAGSTAMTFARFAFSTLSISPTLPSALIAPSSSMRMSSSLRRFPGSFQESRFAIN